MSEVITEKDKEYEAREEANAPGADQAMSDRVNNRSLRPNSSAFIDFMKTGWDASEPEIEPLESRSSRRRDSPHWARRSPASVW